MFMGTRYWEKYSLIHFPIQKTSVITVTLLLSIGEKGPGTIEGLVYNDKTYGAANCSRVEKYIHVGWWIHKECRRTLKINTGLCINKLTQSHFSIDCINVNDLIWLNRDEPTDFCSFVLAPDAPARLSCC